MRSLKSTFSHNRPTSWSVTILPYTYAYVNTLHITSNNDLLSSTPCLKNENWRLYLLLMSGLFFILLWNSLAQAFHKEYIKDMHWKICTRSHAHIPTCYGIYKIYKRCNKLLTTPDKGKVTCHRKMFLPKSKERNL